MHIKVLLTRLCLVLMFFGALQTSETQLFKKKKKKESTEQSKKDNGKKNGIKPYSKVITKDAETDQGLFHVHKVEDKTYYEIPDSLFGREMLMVSRISKTASGIGFGGGKINTQVLRWEKKPKSMAGLLMLCGDSSVPVPTPLTKILPGQLPLRDKPEKRS